MLQTRFSCLWQAGFWIYSSGFAFNKYIDARWQMSWEASLWMLWQEQAAARFLRASSGQ